MEPKYITELVPAAMLIIKVVEILELEVVLGLLQEYLKVIYHTFLYITAHLVRLKF